MRIYLNIKIEKEIPIQHTNIWIFVFSPSHYMYILHCKLIKQTAILSTFSSSHTEKVCDKPLSLELRVLNYTVLHSIILLKCKVIMKRVEFFLIVQLAKMWNTLQSDQIPVVQRVIRYELNRLCSVSILHLDLDKKSNFSKYSVQFTNEFPSCLTSS